jgi:hypothetical protein
MSMPEEELEEHYKGNIARFARILTNEVAYEILGKAVDDRLDSIKRQLFSLDGAFANEAAQILREYPRWNFRFEMVPKDGSEPARDESLLIVISPMKMTEEERDREAAEINDKIQKAATQYWKIVKVGDGRIIPIQVLPMEQGEG